MYRTVVIKQISSEMNNPVFRVIQPMSAVIGREISCEIPIFSQVVSRRHCEISWKDDSPVIKDLHSQNGTFLNGTEIRGEVRLKGGDKLSLAGKIELRIDIEEHHSADPSIKSIISNVSEEDFDLSGIEDYESEDMLRDLNTLYKIGNIISSLNDLESVLTSTGQIISDVISPDRTVVMLKDEKSGNLKTVSSFRQDDIPQDNLPISNTIINKCINEKISIISDDALRDDRFDTGESIITGGIRSVICAPICSNEKILGVLYLDSVSICAAFRKRDLALISAIGKQVGMAIARARLFESKHGLLIGAINTLVALIEAKDSYTHGHSAMVTYYAIKIAEELDLPRQDIKLLKVSAMLHDIGKVGIPEVLLHKKQSLSKEEFDTIREHPVQGAMIVKNIEGTEEIVKAIYHHHERYDGSGYPEKLSAGSIPLFARILCIADSFDAMTSDRPYRQRLSRQEAIEEIERNAGAQFDPEITEVFIKWLQENQQPTLSTVFEFIDNPIYLGLL